MRVRDRQTSGSRAREHEMTLQQSTPRIALRSAERDDDVLFRRALAKTIRRLRRDRELSQAELGERTGLARNHIGEIERVPRNLTLQTIVSLARAFDMHVSELLARAEEFAREQASNQRSPDGSAAP
ncbi:MAG: helix-turn-helix transcriptional regulator [Actinobacteria bacterium]|nr:helix-turn-helix transcriptional regulator [Actinomycetota bacterium]